MFDRIIVSSIIRGYPQQQVTTASHCSNHSSPLHCNNHSSTCCPDQIRRPRHTQPITPCFQPLVYLFVLWSLSFCSVYILDYFVIRTLSVISNNVVLCLPSCSLPLPLQTSISFFLFF